MERKKLSRHGWQRVLEGTSILIDTYDARFGGYAAATFITRARRPLVGTLGTHSFLLADDGYVWIQRLPADAHWSLTTMYDSRGEIVQWYFDITRQNGVDAQGQPYYDDLYLDIAVLPTGEHTLLDADELRAALDSRDITAEDYAIAWAEANRLMAGPALDIPALTRTAREDLSFFQARLATGQTIHHE